MANILHNFKKDLKKVGRREKVIILSILLTAFVVGIAGSYVYKNKTKQPNGSVINKLTITPSPLPKTSLLSLISEVNEVISGNKFDVTLELNSGDSGVDAADFVVNFDPDYLKVATVASGIFFQNYPIKMIKNNFVKISGVAELTDSSLVVPKGEGAVATITFEAKQATASTEVKIDKIKTVIASGGQNILNINNLYDLKIAIK